jgi:hypothetical protein
LLLCFGFAGAAGGGRGGVGQWEGSRWLWGGLICLRCGLDGRLPETKLGCPSIERGLDQPWR